MKRNDLYNGVDASVRGLSITADGEHIKFNGNEIGTISASGYYPISGGAINGNV
jgi:hypothetical protein